MAMGTLSGIYLFLTSAGPRKLLFAISSISFLALLMLSNSRSPLIFVLAACIPLFLALSPVNKVYYSFAASILFSIFFFYSEYVRSKIYSVVNIFIPHVGESMSGSTIDMRVGQFNVALSYFADSPYWGNGLGFTREIVSSGAEPELYDSESALFPIMIDQGLIGVLGYFLFFLLIALSFKFRGANSPLIRSVPVGLILGYLVFSLATGFMYTLPFFIYMVVVMWCDYRERSVRHV